MASSIHADLMNVNFYWSDNTGVSMYRSPWKNVSYLYFTNSDQHVVVLLGWFLRWEASGCTAAVLLSAAFMIFSKWYPSFLCSSHLTFSPSVLLKSRWCSHTIVPTWLQLGKNQLPALSILHQLLYYAGNKIRICSKKSMQHSCLVPIYFFL